MALDKPIQNKGPPFKNNSFRAEDLEYSPGYNITMKPVDKYIISTKSCFRNRALYSIAAALIPAQGKPPASFRPRFAT